MDIIPGKKSKLVVPLEVVLGSVPLNSIALAKPAHSRMHSNTSELQERRQSVGDFESRFEKGMVKHITGNTLLLCCHLLFR